MTSTNDLFVLGKSKRVTYRGRLCYAYPSAILSCSDGDDLKALIFQPCRANIVRFPLNTLVRARGAVLPSLSPDADIYIDTAFGNLEHIADNVSEPREAFFAITGTVDKRWHKGKEALVLESNIFHSAGGWWFG